MVMYARSQIDKSNSNWFLKHMGSATLASIQIEHGAMRGLGPFQIDFEYPISAIAGGNGAGKSTLLALAACAFHNSKTGYKPDNSRQTYYTFSDFFVQSVAELPPQGVSIRYEILHKSWNAVPKAGRISQRRRKAQGGKWNDYHRRVKRNVVYFGVQRVVPYFERTVYRSYRSRFKPTPLEGNIEVRIKEIAGRIIGRTYSEFEAYQYSKYSLPVVKVGQTGYSGFNMGAGESAIFDILTALLTAGEGTLLVVDELELGLHEAAQYRLVEELKKLCLEMHCQIICSTHSQAVLESLPPEACFFLESRAGQTVISKGVTPEFACGNMGKKNAQELDILVEDTVSRDVLTTWLPLSLRKRVNILPIGSHTALENVMAARWLEQRSQLLCIMDGDQSNGTGKAVKRIVNATQVSQALDRSKVQAWAEESLFYLPSQYWPEKWLLSFAKNRLTVGMFRGAEDLVQAWNLHDKAELEHAVEQALLAGKHKEFSALATTVELNESQVRVDFVRAVKASDNNALKDIVEKIEALLDG